MKYSIEEGVEHGYMTYRMPVSFLKEYNIPWAYPFKKQQLDAFWKLGYDTKNFSIKTQHENGKVAIPEPIKQLTKANTLYSGPSLLGIERTDKEWLDSGLASQEAHHIAFKNAYGSELREVMGWEESEEGVEREEE